MLVLDMGWNQTKIINRSQFLYDIYNRKRTIIEYISYDELQALRNKKDELAKKVYKLEQKKIQKYRKERPKNIKMFTELIQIGAAFHEVLQKVKDPNFQPDYI